MHEGDDWLTPTELGAWNSFMATAHLLQRRIDMQLADAGITQVQYELLHHLSTADNGQMTMTELASATVSSRSGLTYQVAQLEDRGLVTRSRDDQDQRQVIAQLTDSGRKALEAAAPGHVAVVRYGLFSVLDHDDIEALADLMSRTSRHLREDYGAGT